MPPPPLSVIRRGAGAVRQRGAAAVARTLVTRLLYARETHIWFEADLTRERGGAKPLEAEIVEVGADLLPAALRVQGASTEMLQQRLDGRARLWAATVEGEVGFVCWTFTDRTPVFAARGGWLALPAGVECLEDSFTAPEFRGRGLAPQVWRAIEDHRAQAGVHSLITKVGVENVASCRAVARAGFEHVATMQLLRRGPQFRVRVDGAPKGIGAHLAAELGR